MFAKMLVLPLCALLVGTAAFAQPTNLTKATDGFTYFNRPGADSQGLTADLLDCADATSQTVDPYRTVPYGAGGLLAGALAAALVMPAFESAAGKSIYGVNIENCMVAKQWRVVRLSNAEGGAIAKLDAASQATTLQAWVGLATPHGDIVRSFANEGASASTVKDGRADGWSATSLSVTSLDAQAIRAHRLSEARYAGRRIRELPAGQTPDLSGDNGLIIVHLKGLGHQNGEWMSFRRLPDTGSTDPQTAVYFEVWLPSLPFPRPSDRRDRIQAFVVPPGRWIVNNVGQDLSAVSFCVGAPSFQVSRGEAVFAGTFDLGSDDVGPDMSLATAQSFLADRPAVAATLRPAVWSNGARTSCALPQSFVHATFIYALEIDEPALQRPEEVPH
jgi:hypothetical protein